MFNMPIRAAPAKKSSVKVSCDYCGVMFEKLRCELHEHNFCCREHFYCWNSARISKYNRTVNPMNQLRGVLESRIQRGNILRGRGEGRTYRKRLGRHEHRCIAEEILDRPLKKGEAVHHIDGDKLNNSPKNLLVLPSQAEHARIHFSKGGYGGTATN